MCYMNLKRTFMVPVLLIWSAVSMTGCPGNQTLNLDYKQPKAPEGLPLSVHSLRINLLDSVDKRAGQIDPQLIGFRQAAFDVQMGAVYSDLPVTKIVQEAVKSELTRSGHIIDTENEDFTIKGEIRTYWVSTPATFLYWDVTGEVSILVKVKRNGTDSFIEFGPFTSRNVERTYLNPSVEIMKRVLGASLQKVMQTMSSDTELGKVLSKN
jgi:uncharacterized lipoprotein YajG